jgi:hypothetical protein
MSATAEEKRKFEQLELLRTLALTEITKKFPPRFGEREGRVLNPTVAQLATFMAEFAWQARRSSLLKENAELRKSGDGQNGCSRRRETGV